MESQALKSTFSTVFFEIINLKYNEFLGMVKDLNSIAEYFVDEEGYSLSFDVVKGTDTSFLWKLTVRIECSKSKVENKNEKTIRLLRLNQFINIYNHIKLQSEALKILEQSENSSNTNFTIKGASNLKESKIYDVIQSMSMNDSDCKDEEICCICMENRSNLILSCTHNYCEKCIKEWQVTNNTCPLCRCSAGENDGFILADKPNYYNLQEEMSKSLFQITETPKTKHLTSFLKSSSDEEDDND